MALSQIEIDNILTPHFNSSNIIQKFLRMNLQDVNTIISYWYSEEPLEVDIGVMFLSLSPRDLSEFFKFKYFSEWVQSFCSKWNLGELDTLNVPLYEVSDVSDIIFTIINEIIGAGLEIDSPPSRIYNSISSRNLKKLASYLSCAMALEGTVSKETYLNHLFLEINFGVPRWESLGLSAAPTSGEIGGLINE